MENLYETAIDFEHGSIYWTVINMSIRMCRRTKKQVPVYGGTTADAFPTNSFINIWNNRQVIFWYRGDASPWKAFNWTV